MPAIPRPAKGTAAKAKAKRRAALVRHDEAESAKVRERSGGRCEIQFADGSTAAHEALWFLTHGEHPHGRCIYNAVHVHHRLSGRGVRGRGASALAINKLHVCEQDHAAIHAKRLIPDGANWRRAR